MASQYRRRSLMLNTIAKVAQGNPTIITDSSSRRLQKLNIYGQSEQDSTTGTNFLSDEDKRKTVDNAYYYENVGFNLKSGTKYILNTSEIVSGIYFMDYVSKEILAVTYQNTKVEYTPEEDKTVYFQIYNSGSLSDDVLIWLNVGKYSEYEPYTGGKPSPSPDYPQEIISKEVSEIKVTNGADLSQTITLPEPITLRGISVSSGGNVTIDGQQYVSDVITEKDGVIGVERNAKESIFDGSEDEVVSVGEYLGNVTRTTIAIENSSYNITFSDKFKFINNYDLDEPHFYYWNNVLYLFVPIQLTSPQQFKEWLQTNPVGVVYTLEAPTFEPLPEEIQTQYKALKSYYPNTVIQTGCWNEVTYSAKRGG